MKLKILILFFLFSLVSEAQIDKIKQIGSHVSGAPVQLSGKESDTISDENKLKIPVFSISKYKRFYIENDTVAVDTTLTINSYYKLNYKLKNDFNLLSFSNMGFGFNHLTLQDDNLTDLLPGFVADAKTDNILKKNEVPFFRVPTTYSDLFYINGIKQGQMLRALFTTNIYPNLNLAVSYKGISSLGLYKHNVTSLGRFFITSNYISKNKRYALMFFYALHDVSNEENGGIKNKNQFENGGILFKKRNRIEVNFTDANSLYKNNQTFLKQSYKLLKQQDIQFVNTTYFEKRRYKYEQNSPKDIFGDAFTTQKIKDTVALKQFDNFTGINFKYKGFKIQAGVDYVYQEYRLDSIKTINNNEIPRILVYNDLYFNSKVSFRVKKLLIKSKLLVSPSKNLKSYVFDNHFSYAIDSLTQVNASFTSTTKRPDFKFLLYQSGYKKFNWYNADFKNVFHQKIKVNVSRAKWGKFEYQQDLINNYTYFSTDTIPAQFDKSLIVSSFRYNNLVEFGKFGLSTDLLYQKVLSGKSVLHLPSYVLRGTVFFTDRYFKKHLLIQTGFSARYFEGYYADAYHPVLGDFILQDKEKIGYYPLIDFFFNFKVKRFRFYLKADHLNALFEYKKPKYYTAVGYPYYDFSIRFGINWLFFN